MSQTELPQRKRLAHPPPVERNDRPVILFVTLAVQPRGDFLATDLFLSAFLGACSDADAWLVGRYVIMPDHVHLFCAPARWPTVEIRKWVRYLKERITKRLGRRRRGSASPSRDVATWHWQPDFWDTQMRNGDQYHEKWLYVRENPVRAALVGDAERWSFQGELNVLLW
jgi:putative transposase